MALAQLASAVEEAPIVAAVVSLRDPLHVPLGTDELVNGATRDGPGGQQLCAIKVGSEAQRPRAQAADESACIIKDCYCLDNGEVPKWS